MALVVHFLVTEFSFSWQILFLVSVIKDFITVETLAPLLKVTMVHDETN